MSQPHILATTDLSTASRSGPEAAAFLASATGARVTILHLVESASLLDLPSTGDNELADRALAFARERLEELRKDVFGEMEVDVVVHDLHSEELQREAPELKSGFSVSGTICAIARRLGATSVVMSTHGRTGLSRFVLGSTAERVVRHAPCEVLTIKPGVKLGPVGRLLCATDFSPSARRALARASNLARTLKAELDVIHVRIPAYVLSQVQVPVEDARMRVEAERTLQRNVDALAEGLTTHIHVVEGKAAHEIIRMAGELGTQLVVLSSIGHTAVERFLIGSVAERVVRQSDVPVLTVRG